MKMPQALIGAGVLALGVALAVGAVQIPPEVGYAGVGPNFLPWLVAGALLLCGAALLREALTGGYRDMEAPSGAESGDWRGFAWVSAGILANAALIERLGFILSCALCFTLAVHGLRSSEGARDHGVRPWVRNALIGMAITAPVYWLFGKLLDISLPGITSTGWV